MVAFGLFFNGDSNCLAGRFSMGADVLDDGEGREITKISGDKDEQ